MKTNLREIVYAKFDGKCAYCGIELNGKFQVDHLIAKARFVNKVLNEEVPNYLLHLDTDDVDHIDNLMPSCHSCNNYKHSLSIDEFRKQLSFIVSRLNEYHTIYKIAKRYNLIEEINKPVIFYFETLHQ